ncbi:DUF1289 domain-containing protein [Variovorax sp. J31P207]|uniref:DUF1289 domain-containing protein n=1 Tax=Variovorax sp. J31P207 TaxID=3053510 RepID=UPI0025761325|nr:DUF1289 domain-containing protein [Variovorax sp. J31P207]MDM0072589.1 DUF1289 domain-containing protein [Variovorax sp. J31P207]
MSQNHLIADPCINICRMDQDGRYCQGCKRTALEIGAWPRMAEQHKAEVLALIELRMSAVFTPALDDTAGRIDRPRTAPFERQPNP